MKQLTHKQRLALVWRATPPAHRSYMAGQKSVLAFRRSMLHMLPLTALSQCEIHLRVHMALRMRARAALAEHGFPSLLAVDGLPWAVAFDRGSDPAVVHLQEVVRGITTPAVSAPLEPADFTRRFIAAQAFAAKLNALAIRKPNPSDKEKIHE